MLIIELETNRRVDGFVTPGDLVNETQKPRKVGRLNEQRAPPGMLRSLDIDNQPVAFRPGLGPFRESMDLKLGFVNMEARILGPNVVSRGGGRGRGPGGPP